MRRFRNVTLMTVAMSLVLGQWAAAQALKHVPADALFFIRINNAQQVSQKVSKLATELGVAQFQPALQDPLAALKQGMGIQEGLREDGEIVFVFVDPATSGVAEDESMFVLIPVADYQAFLGNFENAKTEGDVSEFMMGGNAQTFSANWGDYAAISPSREMIAQQPQNAISIEGLATEQLESQDAVFYANFEKISAVALPALRDSREEIRAEIVRNIQAGNPEQQKFEPVISAAVDQGMDVAEQFLQDARSATVSLTIGDNGITSTTIAEFKPDTYGARMISQLQGSRESLVSGLPQSDYLMYGGSAVDPQVTAKLVDDFMAPIVDALGKVEGSDAEAANRLVATLKDYYSASTSQSWGMLAPTGALGQESLFQIVAIARGDAQRLRAAQRDLFQLQNDLMQAFSGAAADQVTINYAENAATVGDVQFDRFTTEFQIDPNNPDAAQANQALQMIYGPEGLGGFVGVVDDKMVSATGLSEERLQEVVEAARAEQSLITGKPHIEAVASELPEQRVVIMYLPLDQWARTGAAYAGQFGMPVQLQLPPELPPIGMSVTGQETGLRIDTHVPTELVQSLIAAGMQAMMGQMGGGGPGGPGGL